MTYRVEIEPGAAAAIREAVRYLAEEKQSPVTAERWLAEIHRAAASLAGVPQAGPLAPESEFVDYEIRMRLVGQHLLLYAIDEPSRTVRVIGFRHGARLPRSGDLPDEPRG